MTNKNYLGGGLVLRCRELLAADNQRYVIDQRIVNTLTGRLVDWLTQVDAGHLCSDVFLDLGNLHRPCRR